MIRQVTRAIARVANSLAAYRWGNEYSFDVLPPERIRAAASLPHVRGTMIEFSKQEYERNPYYQAVINNLASHTIGPHPSIIGNSDNSDWDDTVEDAHLDWLRDNKVGKTYREIRKQAALTGLGIAIPFKNSNTQNPVSLSYKVYGADALRTPYQSRPEDRIFGGIEYDKNWEPVKFHMRDMDKDLSIKYMGMEDTKEYTLNEVLFWSQGYDHGMLTPIPECYAAFTIYPFIRRFLQAAIEGEEFRASFPMAIELDPNIYSPSTQQKQNPPYGEFEYEPRSIKTLPVGAKLTGFPQGMASAEKAKLIRLFAATCALTVNMPANLALGDSSDSNMASAQVDIQPWGNKIEIDRFDMEPVLRKSFREWYSVAALKDGVFGQYRAPIYRTYPFTFPHSNVYVDIHSHPDPTKRANARMIDLASGATTLNRIYSKNGQNARREIKRDAELFGRTPQEMLDNIFITRSNRAIELIQEPDNVGSEN